MVVAILSRLTIIYSGVFSFLERDFKKLVALSTLRQVGLLIYLISLNLLGLICMHLSSHALFKSLLFFRVGMIIHRHFSSQESRFYSIKLRRRRVVLIRFILRVLNLIGMVYLSGRITKEAVLEVFTYQSFIFF